MTIAVGPQGAGSGLDADLLDGNHASAFALASHTHPDATPTDSGFMSAADKEKLDGIEAGAQVNQNAYSRVIVGSTNIDAVSPTDFFRLIAGTNIRLTPDLSNKSITIEAPGGGDGPVGYETVVAGSATLIADPGDALVIQGQSPITVSGDAATDTVTIGIQSGHGSGLDADLLDGLHAAAFALASHEHSLSVQLGVNSSSVSINSTSYINVTSVSLTPGKWILIGVLHATTSGSTAYTLTVALRIGSTILRSLGYSFNTSIGPRTIVLMLLHTVESDETITLDARTSNTSTTFSIGANAGYLLAIRYSP